MNPIVLWITSLNKTKKQTRHEQKKKAAQLGETNLDLLEKRCPCFQNMAQVVPEKKLKLKNKH